MLFPIITFDPIPMDIVYANTFNMENVIDLNLYNSFNDRYDQAGYNSLIAA